MTNKHRIVKAIFTKRKLTALQAVSEKKYTFACDDYDVKIGDMIESPVYATPLEIIDVSYSDSIPVDPRGFGPVKQLIISSINFNDVDKPTLKSNKMQSNSMFSGIIGKYNSQFIPEKERNVRMSLNGLLCVPVDGEYVGIDKDDILTSFPAEMTIEIPVYSIVKMSSQLKPGEIIKNGNSYSKFIGLNPDGSLKTLSFSGYSHNKKPVQDFLLGAATTRVLINMFNFDNNMGFNPLFFAMANGDTIDVSSLLALSMTSQGKDLFSNIGGGFNPAMLWMLDSNRKGNNNNLMETMVMMQFMGGNNPFANMFAPKQEVVQTPQQTPSMDLSALIQEAVDKALAKQNQDSKVNN